MDSIIIFLLKLIALDRSR